MSPGRRLAAVAATRKHRAGSLNPQTSSPDSPSFSGSATSPGNRARPLSTTSPQRTQKESDLARLDSKSQRNDHPMIDPQILVRRRVCIFLAEPVGVDEERTDRDEILLYRDKERGWCPLNPPKTDSKSDSDGRMKSPSGDQSKPQVSITREAVVVDILGPKQLSKRSTRTKEPATERAHLKCSLIKGFRVHWLETPGLGSLCKSRKEEFLMEVKAMAGLE